MKTEFYICMTSGIEGPKTELSEELSKEISDLALQLDKPWDGSKFAGHGLGVDHYAVSWYDDPEAPVQGVYTDATGFVRMWKKGDDDWHTFKDTVGLWAKLAPTASKAYQQWLEDAKKAMEDCNQQYGVPIYKIHNP